MSDSDEIDVKTKEMGGFHDRPDVIDLHRALGGYVTVFSELMSTMRLAINAFFLPPDTVQTGSDDRLDILLATMTAKPMSDAFFGLVHHLGKLDDDARRIARTLRSNVAGQIEFRNDLMHSEWSVGWADGDTGEPVPASARRIKAISKIPRTTDLSIAAVDIESAIDAIDTLVRAVRVLGWSARNQHSGRGPRVTEALELVESESGAKVRVLQHPYHWYE